MTDVLHILNAVEQGDTKAADQLLPLVYEELHSMAAQKMSRESPSQILAGWITNARLKPQEALSVAQQIAEAVGAALEHNVIDPGLRPGNLKITPEGKVKLLEFGMKNLAAHHIQQKCMFKIINREESKESI